MTKDEAINGIKLKIKTNCNKCECSCIHFIEQPLVCCCNLTREPLYMCWDVINNKTEGERTETCKALFKED